MSIDEDKILVQSVNTGTRYNEADLVVKQDTFLSGATRLTIAHKLCLTNTLKAPQDLKYSKIIGLERLHKHAGGIQSPCLSLTSKREA